MTQKLISGNSYEKITGYLPNVSTFILHRRLDVPFYSFQKRLAWKINDNPDVINKRVETPTYRIFRY